MFSVGLYAPAAEVSIERAQHLFNTNFFGAMELVRLFLPQLIQAGGCVVNNGSLAGTLPHPWLGIYSASKAALEAYTRTLYYELAPLGVRARYIQCGNVEVSGGQKRTSLDGCEHLKPDSVYSALGDTSFVQSQKNGTGGMPAQAFARQFAERVMEPPSWLWGNDCQIWIGNWAGTGRLCRLLMAIWPWDFMGWIFSTYYNLPELDRSKIVKDLKLE